VKKWILEHGNEKHVFNDLALTANGDAFISDSNSDIVFHAGPHLDKPEVWVVDPRLKDGNGIAALNDDFIVINAAIGFYKINLKTKTFLHCLFLGIFRWASMG